MTIQSGNTPNASDANSSGAAYTGGNTGLNTPGAAFSGSPYATPVGTDATRSSASATGKDASSSKNANMQMLNDAYTKASSWVKANPKVAISAAAGIFAALFGIFGSRRKSGSSRDNRYPNGQTFGKPYGSGSINYDPTTQTESYNPGTGTGQQSSRY